jgi:hypothetical protein
MEKQMIYCNEGKVTDSKAANAFLKGQCRESQDLCDSLITNRQSGKYSQVKKNAKLARVFFEEELNSYGKFLVSSVDYKNYVTGKTKHWKSEYTAIEPELIKTEGIGSLCRFVVGYFDSRRFCKSKPACNIKFTSQFYFHEHFLARCILRLNEKYVGEIGSFIYPIMEWLIMENVPLTRIEDISYFVYRDFTLVAEKLPNSYGMAFKTILETEFYKLEDKRKFAKAHQLLSQSDSKSIQIVMTNESGGVIRKIPASKGESLVNTLTEKTFWLRHILDSPDIRDFQ